MQWVRHLYIFDINTGDWNRIYSNVNKPDSIINFKMCLINDGKLLVYAGFDHIYRRYKQANGQSKEIYILNINDIIKNKRNSLIWTKLDIYCNFLKTNLISYNSSIYCLYNANHKNNHLIYKYKITNNIKLIDYYFLKYFGRFPVNLVAKIIQQYCDFKYIMGKENIRYDFNKPIKHQTKCLLNNNNIKYIFIFGIEKNKKKQKRQLFSANYIIKVDNII